MHFLLILLASLVAVQAYVLPRQAGGGIYPNTTNLSEFNGRWFTTAVSPNIQSFMQHISDQYHTRCVCETTDMLANSRSSLAVDSSCVLVPTTATQKPFGKLRANGILQLRPPTPDIDVSQHQYSFQFYLGNWSVLTVDGRTTLFSLASIPTLDVPLNAAAADNKTVFFWTSHDANVRPTDVCDPDNTSDFAALLSRNQTIDVQTFNNTLSQIHVPAYQQTALHCLAMLNETCPSTGTR